MNRGLLVAVGLLAIAPAAWSQFSTGPGPSRPRGGPGQRRFAPNVPDLLIKAIRTQPNLTYTGTYTTEFRQGADTTKHQEFITRAGKWYRIDFPPGSKFSGQVIIENDMMRQHYMPIPNEVMQQPPRHGEAWEKVANLANSNKFQLATAPGETIAGYKTEQLVVSDKVGNVMQRLYIEPISGLIMKRLIFDLVGTQIGFFQFDSVNFNPHIDRSVFLIKRKNVQFVTPLMQLQRICKRRGFEVHALPPATGFELEGSNFKQFAGVDGLVETYLNLNGNVRLWMYVLKAPVDPEKLRNGIGKNQHIYSVTAKNETIVLLGAVDEQTLSRFGSMLAGGGTPASRR